MTLPPLLPLSSWNDALREPASPYDQPASVLGQEATDPLADQPVLPHPAAPVPTIDKETLRMLAGELRRTFEQYVGDRRLVEERWLKNLRQYRGEYDPEVEQQLGPTRSKAYPRVTRVKVISVLSRIMNLMFPGNERHWQLNASPSADLDPQEVMRALATIVQDQPMTDERLQYVVQRLAEQRAEQLATLLDDQLQEIGGDQTHDFATLNRQVALSGVLYGMGVAHGPFAREERTVQWQIDPMSGMPSPQEQTVFKPVLEFLPVWDFYPDMSAKTLDAMDGYFTRLVMTRAQLRDLADRADFVPNAITQYLTRVPKGNYRAQPFEQELRAMSSRAHVPESRPESGKYEVIVWHGPITSQQLMAAGADVPQELQGEDLDAEVWMIDDTILKADLNPWRRIGLKVPMVHTFLFDEDDTVPVGNGLPQILRDSQMSVAASARMLLDNASIVCGPNLELNTDLLRPDQDLTQLAAYRMWYREGTGPEAQYPAVRNVSIDAHLDDLLKVMDTFMRFADMETFVGPATGGDMERKGASEPMRTAAGASMLRGDAALPFKDIVRNFDRFTQSVIYALVQFNKKLNPAIAPSGDFNVVARGATSLIAKEVRAMQLDMLAQTLTPEEKMHLDGRKFVQQRLAVRDLSDLLLPEDEVQRKMAEQSQQAEQMTELQRQAMQAEIKKTMADAFKGIAQGQKNTANADAAQIKGAMELLQAGLDAEIPSGMGGMAG
jgi:hypothetical protein